jgi:hypothetical protein
MKKLIIASIALIIFSSNPVKAQDQFAKRCSTIKAFIAAVFNDKKDTRFIMNNYMFIATNDTISQAEKENVINAMVDALVKTNGKILASSDYESFAYDDFKGDKKKFNTGDYSDIMILSVKNKAIIYFNFNMDRIVSFFEIEKGSLSFFLTI